MPEGVPHDASFYVTCMFGGVLSCGLTHTAVCPLDVIKCRMQTNPAYTGVFQGAKLAIQTGGIAELTTGWLPTLIGYSFQGLAKFGGYEFFKDRYTDLVGFDNAVKYRGLVYAASSASAEFFADILLCPWESAKVRMQTAPPEAMVPRQLGKCMGQMYAAEGMSAFFKGVVPLWSRQIPYTVAKFVFFEAIVEFLYNNIFTRGKENYTKGEKLGITFLSGYLAGIICAIVSQAPDTIVSKLNQSSEATIGAIVKEHGLVSLATKGLAPRIIMIGTLTGLQWWIYDAWKTFRGLGVSGGIQKK